MTASSRPGQTPEFIHQDSRRNRLETSEKILIYVGIIPASSATVPSGGDGLYERRKEGRMMRMMMKMMKA